MTAEEVLKEIVRICERFSVEQVYLYGSRAKGTNRERSDIDVAVAGVEDFAGLAEAVEELDTLYKIDLLNLDTCGNRSLLEDVALYGKKIFETV